jgi:hypothetical protein
MTGTDPREEITGVRALAAIAAAALPTAAAFCLLFACAAVWQRIDPAAMPSARGGVERSILQVQIERTATIARDVDVLAVGDSAGLMGIDAPLLGDLLGGKRVEVLNTVAFSGPRGHARMLERFLDSGGRPRRVLLALSGFSLAAMNNWRRWEKMALDGVPQDHPPAALLPGVRARLLSVVGSVLYAPMSGAWGDVYGPPEGFTRFVRAHGGSAIEPNGHTGVGPRELSRVIFQPNEPYRKALEPLAAAIERLGAERARLVFMPYAAFYESEEVDERQRETELAFSRVLKLDASRRLDVPAALPDRYFGTQTHLNREGRRVFTEALARALSTEPIP